MIVSKKVSVEVNGYITYVEIVCDSEKNLNDYENRIKDTYYKGRKHWKKTDTFKILKGEILKKKIGL